MTSPANGFGALRHVKDLSAARRVFALSPGVGPMLEPFMNLPIEDALCRREFWSTCFFYAVYPSTLLAAVATSPTVLAAVADALSTPKTPPSLHNLSAAGPPLYYGERVRETFRAIEDQPGIRPWADVPTERAAEYADFWRSAFADELLSMCLEPALMMLVLRVRAIRTAIMEACLLREAQQSGAAE